MTVLVVGGTGNIGGEVMGRLLKAGKNVRCMTRFQEKIKALPAGIEGCAGDLDKPATLARAFDGAEEVFLLTPLSQNETDQGLAAVEAAKRSGVKKIVYLSVPMPQNATHIPHYKSKIPVENAIKRSGMAYTVLRPNNFFQNDFLWCQAAIMSYNVYPQPIGSVGLNRVDMRDVADAALNAFIQPGHDGKEYPLHGPDVLTGEAVAEIFGRHLGKKVWYGGNDLEAWSKQAQHMMPEWMVQYLRIMFEFFQKYGCIATQADFAQQKKILGHEPRSFDSFVAEIVPIWQQAAR